METASILTLIGILLLAGALSSRLSSKANLPILLFFLAVGMIVGEDGLNVINFTENESNSSINFLGTVAMSFILYSGGMNTRFSSVRKVISQGILLATCGVLVTATTLGLFAYVICSFFGVPQPFAWCLLLGALISSTDAAAVFALLRGRNVSLKGEYLQPLLELESGSNDPTAYLLTIIMISILKTGRVDSFWSPLLQIGFGMLWGIGIGALLGFAAGIAGQWIYTMCGKHKLVEQEGLYFVIGVALVLLTFGVTEKYINANGLMAAYVCGITMGNLRFNFKKGLTQFSDGVAWLMQIALFTTLGILVTPHELIEPNIFVPGLILSGILLFIARPLAIWLVIGGKNFGWREKVFIGWVGIRGAAPIMLATFPFASGINGASYLFDLIFFMVIISMLAQGPTLMPLARKLKLAAPLSYRPRVPLELEMTSGSSHKEMFEFEVPPGAAFSGKKLSELGLPSGVLIMLVRRDGEFLQPNGSTVIQQEDGLLCMGNPEVMEKLHRDFFPESDYQPVRSFEEIGRQIPLTRRLKRSLKKHLKGAWK